MFKRERAYLRSKSTRQDWCLSPWYFDDEILLFVQEDKGHLNDSDPEPQLIAEAIATFAANNHTGERTLGIPPHPFNIMPGITLMGSPEEAVSWTGDVVHAHISAVPCPARRWDEGMKPSDNKRFLFRGLQAIC